MTTSDGGPPVELGVLAKANRLLRPFSTRPDGNILPLTNQPGSTPTQRASDPGHGTTPASHAGTTPAAAEKGENENESHNGEGRPGSSRADEGGSSAGSARPKLNIWTRFYRTARAILLHSWLNVLLVFVPVGIVVKFIPGVHVAVVFAVNCIAIVPLAGLLSHATESVASNLGDTIGALMNVTFGNAVELIIL